MGAVASVLDTDCSCSFCTEDTSHWAIFLACVPSSLVCRLRLWLLQSWSCVMSNCPICFANSLRRPLNFGLDKCCPSENTSTAVSQVAIQCWDWTQCRITRWSYEDGFSFSERIRLGCWDSYLVPICWSTRSWCVNVTSSPKAKSMAAQSM